MDKQKTALMELKQFMHEWTSLDNRRLVCTVEHLNKKIESLLALEKEQMQDFYEEGVMKEYQYRVNSNPKNYKDFQSAEQYYQTKFGEQS